MIFVLHTFYWRSSEVKFAITLFLLHRLKECNLEMVKRREEMVRLTRLNLNGTVFKEDLFQIKLQKTQSHF